MERILLIQFVPCDAEVLQYLQDSANELMIIGKTELRKLSILKIIKLLRKERYCKVYISSERFESNRNILVFKILLLLSRAAHCYLINPKGETLQVYRHKILCIDVPIVFYKILVGLLYASRSYITFFCLRGNRR